LQKREVNMKKKWLVKTLALAVVVLFISASFQPIIAENTTSVGKELDYNNVNFEEAKEYLFQTIIDISNNPEVKQFLNEHKRDLITNNNDNYDFKNAIQKIYSKNPRLLKSIVFTKPKMTIEYLKINYIKGLEIVDILGEEESSKVVKSISTSDSELSIKLKNIILSDEGLYHRASVLGEMNNNLKSSLDFWTFPIICGIIHIILLPAIIDAKLWILGLVYLLLGKGISILLLILAILLGPLATLVELIVMIPYYLFGCDFADDYK
jgi:hypothetical protein